MNYHGHKARRTKYSGIWFRSRLEAKWARRFDNEGIGWQYEPQEVQIDHGRFYTPDFYLEVRHRVIDLEKIKVWVEVKPTWAQAENDDRIRLMSQQTSVMCLFLVGPPEGVWLRVNGPRKRPSFIAAEAYCIYEGELATTWDGSQGELTPWIRDLHEKWGHD